MILTAGGNPFEGFDFIKDKAFAAKCSREVIRQGCEMLGMELSEVVALCIQGMQTVAGELGLGAKQLE